MSEKPTYEELEQRVKQLEQETEKSKQTEAALREIEHQIKQFLALAGVIFVALDDEGNITLINECGMETLGYRREELLGKNWFKTCLPHGNQKDVLDVYHQLLKGEIEPVEYHENPILRKDGEECIIAWHNTILKDPEGKTVGVLSSGEDITERLKTEKHLGEAYEIIKRSPAVTFLWKNIEGWPVEFVSENVMELLGYSADDFVSGRVLYAKVVHPDDLERVVGEVADFSVGKERKRFTHEPYRIVTKDGKIKWLADRTYIRRDEKGKITHYQGIVLDITERKQAEKKLHESEKKLHVLYNNSPDMYVSVSPDDASILLCNETLLNKTGYSREEIIGFPIFKMYHDDCMDEVKKAFQQFVETGVIQDKELILKRKNGGKLDVSLNVDAVRNEAGKILYSISSWRDITERKRVYKALHESEERYRSLFQNNHAAMLLIDPNSANIIDANPAAVTFYGWTQKELTQKKITDINTLSSEQVFQEMKLAKAEQRRRFNFRHRLANGETLDVEVYSGPIIIDNKKLLYSIVHDISSRKRAEKALMQERNKLQDALAKIKTLSGMLPICSNCKKIRDDKGYWNQIEGYIKEHSEAEFTHSICPDCTKKLYPDLDIKE